jgi:iron complex outermembrane recepter protein
MTLVVGVLLLGIAAGAGPQQPPPSPAPPAPPPKFEDKVEVVGVTPIHGVGLPKYKVPANIQVFKAGRVGSSHALDVPSLLSERAASVSISDAQGGSYQPDLVFRGFVGSPLLGASEGLAVYQDGVRINEAFGDTINWDTLPDAAIASLNLIPGSNPLFGLNALGGALSIRTKDGFAFPGRRASVSTGSFGRHEIATEIGGHARSVAYFVAGSLTDEAGWRDRSPSTVRRLFGNLTWRSTASDLNFNVTTASNDLTGNGAAPIGLLDQDRRAVFTYPDRTDNDLALLTFNGQHRLSSSAALDGVVYYRRHRIRTFNGDAADETDDDDEESAEPEFDGVNNMSRTRGNMGGLTAQFTRTTPLWGRANHFIVGAGVDIAANSFDFAAEFANLTPDRGTIGSGVLDEDAFVDLRSRTRTGSLFVTDTWSITPGLGWTASARFNWTSVELRDQIGTALSGDHRFSRVNPAAGLTYQLTPAVNLYASYTQSSRVPTPVELTCADPEDPCRLPNAFVSDPPLEQIVASTWETGARGDRGHASWAVSAFRTTATNDIIFVSSGTLRGEGHFENVERTRRAGVEASVQYDIADRLLMFGAYTVQRATFGSDLRIASQFHPEAHGLEIEVAVGNQLPGVPAQVAKFGVAGTVQRVTAGVTVRVQSGQYLRGDEANLLPRVPGFAVTDARAQLRVTPRVAFTVRIQNAFNAKYHTFGVLGDAELLGESFDDEPRFYSPGSPRAAWAGIDVRF